MNPKQIVKISNAVGVISIMLLMFWVFIFITINIFNFRLFSWEVRNLFTMSIVPILALIFAALAMNIMFNLTLISQKSSFEIEDEE